MNIFRRVILEIYKNPEGIDGMRAFAQLLSEHPKEERENFWLWNFSKLLKDLKKHYESYGLEAYQKEVVKAFKSKRVHKEMFWRKAEEAFNMEINIFRHALMKLYNNPKLIDGMKTLAKVLSEYSQQERDSFEYQHFIRFLEVIKKYYEHHGIEAYQRKLEEAFKSEQTNKKMMSERDL